MSDKWYFSGPLGIGEADPYAPLVVSGEISLKSPDSGIHSLRFKRTDEDNRVHEWALWHMNKEYRKNALEIWEYKTDSSGKSCGGNPADGAMCTPRLVIQEGGNVGIGTPEPKRRLQIGDAVAGIGFEPSDGSPNAGYIRFGDQTGWRLHFGRSTESPEGALNTGTAGVLMTLQDNGNVGIGTPGPTHPLHVKTNWGFLALDTNAAGQDAGVRLMEGGTLKWHIYNAAQAKKLHIAREGLGASLTIDETGNVTIGGALVIAKPTSNDNARAILANLAEGAAIVGSAGGSHEPRIDFYFKYARRVYVASIGGRELPRS